MGYHLQPVGSAVEMNTSSKTSLAAAGFGVAITAALVSVFLLWQPSDAETDSLAIDRDGSELGEPDPLAGIAMLGIPVAAGGGRAFSIPQARPLLEAATQVLAQGQTQRRYRRRRFSPGPAPPFALPLMPVGERLDARGPPTRTGGAPYEFYFTRVAYSGFGLQGFASWSVDYPKADRQFLVGLRRLLGHLDAYQYENPILLTDPELRQFPFLYAVEVGHMRLTDDEAFGLNQYLRSGGFLMMDDFWGTYEWANLESELERILPGQPIVDIDLDHPIFHSFYDIDRLVQVPNVGVGRSGGPTYEKDGYYPRVRGVFDGNGRLMVVINWNCDLGDAWEWAEDPYYPLEFSTYAYQVGVNFIVYAMTH